VSIRIAKNWGILLLLVLLALGACRGASPKQAAQNDAQAQALRDQIVALPSVTTSTVAYANRFGDSGNLAVQVVAKPGTDTSGLADTIEGMAWKTSLNPLNGILLTIDTGVRSEYLSRNVIIKDIASSLEAKYGPRPSPSLPP
jgi:hypothetical protein